MPAWVELILLILLLQLLRLGENVLDAEAVFTAASSRFHSGICKNILMLSKSDTKIHFSAHHKIAITI